MEDEVYWTRTDFLRTRHLYQQHDETLSELSICVFSAIRFLFFFRRVFE